MPSTDFGSNSRSPAGWGGSGNASAGGQGGMGGQKASQPNYEYRNVAGAKNNTIGNWNTGGSVVGSGNQHAVLGPDGRLIGGNLLAAMQPNKNVFAGLGGKGGQPPARQGVPDPRRRGQPDSPFNPASGAPPADVAAILKRLGWAEDVWRWPANREDVPVFNAGTDPTGAGYYYNRGPVWTGQVGRRYPEPIGPVGPDQASKARGPLGSGWDERLPQGDQTRYRSMSGGGYRDQGGFDIRNTGDGLTVGR